MLKKLLFPAILFTLFYAGSAFSQCIPNVSIITPGIYPDSATGLAQGYVGTPYAEVVQARIPLDTVYLGILVPITSFSIDSIHGLPPSFSYACNPGGCVFPGGSNGCILISGTPTATGTFNLEVFGTANGILLGNPAALPFALDYYKIVINAQSGAGIAQNPNNTFTVYQNEPNPFSVFSTINFDSPIGGSAQLKIYNLIGKQVYNSTYRVITGRNSIRVDAKEFDSGIYMYTLQMGDRMVTKRMVVTKK